MEYEMAFLGLPEQCLIFLLHHSLMTRVAAETPEVKDIALGYSSTVPTATGKLPV